MRRFCATVLLSVMFPIFSMGQDTHRPSVAYVYPAGARIGDTVRVIFGGTKLGDAKEVIVSGGGVRATIIEHIKPFRQGEIPRLRSILEKKFLQDNPNIEAKMKELGADGQAFLRAEMLKVPENKKALAEADKSYYLRLLSSDALAETLEVELKISPDTKEGERQILLRTSSGLSQPKKFIISDMPEFVKPSLRKRAIERTQSDSYRGNANSMSWRKYVDQPFEVMSITVPVVANGQITEGAVDRYKFYARAGEKFYLKVDAQNLIPYISDAVPGWFQTVLRVVDDNSKEVAYNDDFYFFPDSRLSFTAQRDGEYTVEIHDAIYRSREDFVYRLSITNEPLYNPVSAFKKLKPVGDYVIFDTQKITKDSPTRAYPVAMKKGQSLEAEVFARRLNSPLDSFLYVRDEKGNVLESSDDFYDETFGLITHHSDSRLLFKAPYDNVFTFFVRDVAGQSSPFHNFTISIKEPKPSLKVISYSSSAGARKGGVLAFKLKIFRGGEKAFPIKLSGKLPKGWKLLNSYIPPNMQDFDVLISTPSDSDFGTKTIELFANATVSGIKLSARVQPADNMMQAFYYRHFVPADSFYCSVDEHPHFTAFKSLKCDVSHLSKGVSVQIGAKAVVKYAKAKKQSSWRIHPIIESDIIKITKRYWKDGWLYVEIEPSEKAKLGDRIKTNITLLCKSGSKLYEFDRTAPVSFLIAKKPEATLLQKKKR